MDPKALLFWLVNVLLAQVFLTPYFKKLQNDRNVENYQN